MITPVGYIGGGIIAVWLLAKGRQRLRLSLAKHPSLRGHARWSQRLSRLLPFYEFTADDFPTADGAPPEVAERRRKALAGLATQLQRRAPRTLALSRELADGMADARFVDAYRVPFPFRGIAQRLLPLGCVATKTEERRICDLDGNWSLDLGGSYGVNLLGYQAYKQCIEAAANSVRELGPVLGPYHPIVADNVRRLQEISGMDEVSFHMSGTEAVMQAVRLARYHTGKSHVVRFCGAYHGWWDGVQAGVGNPRPPHEVYTLADMSPASLRVLATRRDIACVLVNPLQAMHPNGNAPSDSMLLTGVRKASYDKAAYTSWLQELRRVCTAQNIALILDEVFLGFRLAPGGAQEYFGVQADLVTYGKTLGGGLPIGVLCGKARWMKRYRDDKPSDICFARGTFNSHPYVMAAMNEFLQMQQRPEIKATYAGIDGLWTGRAKALNERLAAAGLPLRVVNMVSIWTVVFTQPGRYHWMLQYYLRLHGIALSWVGTGRLIFSHDFNEVDFAEFVQRFVAAAEAMARDGWWWSGPSNTMPALKRQLRRELLAAFFGRRRRPAADCPAVTEPAQDEGVGTPSAAMVGLPGGGAQQLQ